MPETRALTGEDLTVADVWEVAVHRAPVGLTDAARARMVAAREVLDATPSTSTPTA